MYLSLGAALQGGVRQGLEHIREALFLAQELGQQAGVVRSFVIFGPMLGGAGRPTYIAQVCASVEVYLDQLGIPLPQLTRRCIRPIWRAVKPKWRRRLH